MQNKKKMGEVQTGITRQSWPLIKIEIKGPQVFHFLFLIFFMKNCK